MPPPVFVIATPRAGTTYLHHLLALDEERFVGFKLYQTIAPSILLERVFDAVGARPEAVLGGGRIDRAGRAVIERRAPSAVAEHTPYSGTRRL